MNLGIRRIVIGSLCLLLGWLPDMSAQYAIRQSPIVQKAMTLEECIFHALDHNPDLQSVKLDELSGEYQIKEIKAAGLPQVSGSGRYTDNFSLASQLLPGEIFGQPGTTIPVKFGVRHGFTGGVELNQLLFSKSYFTGLKAAEASRKLYQLNTLQTKEELVYNIAQVYFQLQITDQQREILQANLDRVVQLIDITQAQFQEGLVKKVDVDQLRVNHTNLKTEIQNLDIGYDQQISFLKFYMGVPMEEEIQIAGPIDDQSVPPLDDQVSLGNNSTLRILNQQKDLTALELQNVKDGFYPELSAFASYNWQGQTDKLFAKEAPFNSFSAGMWGLSVNVPIFDGFRKKNKAQQIIVKERQLDLNVSHVTNLTRMEFTNASQQLHQSQTLIEQQQENMQLAEELYSIIKLSYQEGVAPLTELLNAETSLKEAQTQFLTATLQRRLAQLDHLKTSGRLVKLVEESGR
ncbi:MAG: TolC family protein [Saprospiraceae bacterium]|nr:TolC family protein [Saprospiraceae bacterium]